MQTSARAAATAPAATASEGVTVLRHLLDQLVTLLLTIDRDVYVARPAPSVSGSVGEHVRHALDHVSALLGAGSATELSYDHRERGGQVEGSPSAAIGEALRLQAALARLDGAGDAPIQVATRLTPAGDTVLSWSTHARELAFVISHTIHHCALMAVLLAVQGTPVPHRFGYAPSTPSAR